MKRIGVAGYMGAGKSTVAALIAEKGYALIDADARAKEIMGRNRRIKAALAGEFGAAVLERGRLSYAKLGKLAFSSARAVRRLNRIVHPAVVAGLRRMIVEGSAGPVVLDAALIPLWRIESWFDVLVWVRAPARTRFERLLAGTTLGREELKRRMDIQEELFDEPGGLPWRMVDNTGSANDLRRRLSFVERNAPPVPVAGGSGRTS